MSSVWLKKSANGKITGNQLPDRFLLFLQAPVNIFRNQAEFTAKNIRRLYSKITGNELPVHFPLFLQSPINIFRNHGSKGHVLFLVL